MYASTDLQDALDVVRRFDPDTYARMQATEWDAVTDPADALAALDRSRVQYGLGDVLTLYRDWAGNDGATYFDPDAAVVPLVVLNLANIAGSARQAGAPVAYETAATLVHEFEHVLQDYRGEWENVSKERAAFAAAESFIRRLPGYRDAMLAVNARVRDMEVAGLMAA